MWALIIDKGVAAQVEKLTNYAYEHPYSLTDLQNIVEGINLLPGEIPEFTLFIPIGFKVVFTIEETRSNRKVRHISISVDVPGYMPSIEHADEIIELFGFKNKISDFNSKDTMLNIEQGYAINFLEYI